MHRLIVLLDGFVHDELLTNANILRDHGFLPGAEDEFERLLRAWCGELEERGFTRLVTFSSESVNEIFRSARSYAVVLTCASGSITAIARPAASYAFVVVSESGSVTATLRLAAS